MSFPYMQNDLAQPAQIQKLNQFQQLSFSPQINQRTGLNPLLLQQQQQQQQQAHVQAQLQAQQQQQVQQQQQQQQVQQAQQQVPGSVPLPITTVKEVWKDNFQQEFNIIRQLITQYNYVSFSTEFPGILARPIGVFTSTNDYHYQTLRTNTDLLNLIQFGISLSDSSGKKPDNIYSTWQFNFRFDLSSEMISNEAFESLIKTGIDFNKHQLIGIDQFEFAELLTSSGLVLLPNVHWTSFHSGYDFGFLISLLTNNQMPSKEEDFLNKLSLFFPNLYDLKILSKVIFNKEAANPKLSLENLADELNIPRLSIFVSTGGQALLTNLSFIEIKNKVHDLTKFNGLIHGLVNESTTAPQQNNSTNNNSTSSQQQSSLLLSGHEL